MFGSLFRILWRISINILFILLTHKLFENKVNKLFKLGETFLSLLAKVGELNAHKMRNAPSRILSHLDMRNDKNTIAQNVFQSLHLNGHSKT